MAEAKAVGYLDLNIAGFDQAITTAKKLVVGLAGTFAAIKTAEWWKDGIEGAIKFGDEMFHASQKLGGFDPGKLFLIQKALENAGLGAEEARSKLDEYLNSGRDISQIFRGADGYAAALQNASKSYGSAASVLSSSAEKLSKVWEMMQSIGFKLKTFFLSMTSEFVKPLAAALEYLDQINLVGVGAAFGKNISAAASILLGLFKNGDATKILAIGVKLAFQTGVNYLSGGMNFASDLFNVKFTDGITDSCKILAEYLNKIFSNEFLQRLGDGLKSIVLSILTIITEAFTAIGATLQSTIKTAMQVVPGHGNKTYTENFDDAVKSQGMNEIAKKNRRDSEFYAGKSAGYDKIDWHASNAPQFKVGEIFKTDALSKQLGELTAKAKLTGDAMVEHAQAGKKETINQQALGIASPFHVIADSLAKVGGGGGYARVLLTAEQREAIKQTKVQEQTLKEVAALNAKTKSPTSGLLNNGNPRN